ICGRFLVLPTHDGILWSEGRSHGPRFGRREPAARPKDGETVWIVACSLRPFKENPAFFSRARRQSWYPCPRRLPAGDPRAAPRGSWPTLVPGTSLAALIPVEAAS